MSIDEVMLVAEDYSMAVHDGRDADCGRLHKALRAAIEQHVAEAVARELETCAKMADEYATWGGSNFYDWFKKLATAIRARGTT